MKTKKIYKTIKDSGTFSCPLTIGQTILMKPDVIANWQYLVLTLLCAALSNPEGKKE